MPATVKPSGLMEEIGMSLASDIPLMIWGAPGIGKSQIPATYAAASGITYLDIRLPLYDPTELKGVSYVDMKSGVLKQAFPDIFPSPNSEDPVIIMLDELSSAPPATQVAAYQLVLDRRIGKYELPKNCFVLAAGNRKGDGGVHYKMASPLANRFAHVVLEPCVAEWSEYAATKNGYHEVLNFLNADNSFLHNPALDELSFPTPRSWFAAFSKLDAFFENEGLTVDADLREGSLINHITNRSFLNVLHSTIGVSAASEYITFVEVTRYVPPDSDLLGYAKRTDVRILETLPSGVNQNYVIYSVSNRYAQLFGKMTDAEKSEATTVHAIYSFLEYATQYPEIQAMVFKKAMEHRIPMLNNRNAEIQARYAGIVTAISRFM